MTDTEPVRGQLLRRLHNRIDRWLDRASLHAASLSTERLRGGGVPCLASQALERAVTVAHQHERDVRLKHIEAPRGVAADGAAPHWRFAFELPARRATLQCDWYLDGDSAAGRFGRECLDARATPFPPPDSLLARQVAAGALGYARLNAAWREQRRSQPDLPLVFIDSDAVLAELQAHGLRIDAGVATLHTEVANGGAPQWLALAPGQPSQPHRCRFG